jgi:hypothetical protein
MTWIGLGLSPKAWMIGLGLFLGFCLLGFLAGRRRLEALASVPAPLSAVLGWALLGLPLDGGGLDDLAAAQLLAVLVLPPFVGSCIGLGIRCRLARDWDDG